MLELTLSSIVVAVQDQMSSDLGGETVILHMGSGVYFGLDEVGTRVWALIQQPRAVAEVCRKLLEEFDVELHRCQVSVLALLREMADAGLIENGREPTA